MPFLLRAAVVGGVAAGVGHHMGRRSQQASDQEAAQNQQIADLQDQQAQAAPAAPAAAAPDNSEDGMAKLTQLKSLLDQGVLTQAEFDMQKQKILMTM
jgi:membrane protease subunit (stomatin/prohibitin family)